MGISADLKSRIQKLSDADLQNGIEVLTSMLEDLGEALVAQHSFMKSELRYRKFRAKRDAQKLKDQNREV